MKARSWVGCAVPLAVVLACSSTSVNEGASGTGATGGADSGTGGSSGAGGANTGGAGGGGAVAGGGGTPDGGGAAPGGGAAGAGGGGQSDASCFGTQCSEMVTCCVAPVGTALQVQGAIQSSGACTPGNPCYNDCSLLCQTSPDVGLASCLACMKTNKFGLPCSTGSSCAAFKACLGGTCAPP
ncbi:MAG: hypothetical protein HYZ29_05000 [Myxococcales bacterium]|nr:hypothetical protein [Myxococcales bacterium]